MNNIILGWINTYLFMKPLYIIESNNSISDLPQLSIDYQIANINNIRGINDSSNINDDLLFTNTNKAELQIQTALNFREMKQRKDPNSVLFSKTSFQSFQSLKKAIVNDPRYVKPKTEENNPIRNMLKKRKYK